MHAHARIATMRRHMCDHFSVYDFSATANISVSWTLYHAFVFTLSATFAILNSPKNQCQSEIRKNKQVVNANAKVLSGLCKISCACSAASFSVGNTSFLPFFAWVCLRRASQSL